MGEPKGVRASWSSQWNNLTRTMEGVARDAAAHNCLHELDCSVISVVQHASIEQPNATRSLRFRTIGTTCEREVELLLLLDRLPTRDSAQSYLGRSQEII